MFLPHRKHDVNVPKSTRLMEFRKIIAIDSEKPAIRTPALWAKAEFSVLKQVVHNSR
jgi:hypothetical protein